MKHTAALLPALLLALACSPAAAPVPGQDPAADEVIEAQAVEDIRPVPDGLNVVLIIGCTVRADQMSPWGGLPAAMPGLLARAESGVRFERTIAQAPWTRPASAAILTGIYPETLGIVEPKGKRNERALPEGPLTLAQRFHRAGYGTLGITANPNLNAIYGFERGFVDYRETSPLMKDRGRKVKGEAVVDRLLEMVDAQRSGDAKRPLYLQALLVDAHAPYPRNESTEGLTEGVPEAVAQYRAGLKRLDQAIAKLEHDLAAKGLTRDNTLFVLVGDHGEAMWYPQHHGEGHGNYLYDSVVRVPWLLWGAGVGQGVEVSGLSAQIDVTPTVLSLVGLPGGDELQGRDWSELAKTGGRTDRERVFTSTWFRTSNRAAVYTDTRMCQRDYNPKGTNRAVATQRKGALIPPFPDACFDYIDDPGFTVPVLDAGLSTAVDLWRREREAELAMVERVVEAQPDAQINEQLEALGYAE